MSIERLDPDSTRGREATAAMTDWLARCRVNRAEREARAAQTPQEVSTAA